MQKQMIELTFGETVKLKQIDSTKVVRCILPPMHGLLSFVLFLFRHNLARLACRFSDLSQFRFLLELVVLAYSSLNVSWCEKLNNDLPIDFKGNNTVCYRQFILCFAVATAELRYVTLSTTK